ncbi:hypothetical protein IAT38_002292 [Cryptococcus sp. DSM 104549]
MSPTSRRVTIEDAPSTSPPAPAAELMVETVCGVDQPVATEEDEEEVWDPAEERLPGEVDGKGKGKEKEKETEVAEEQPWQAVWSPESNAWYFWNTKTGEVSWTNPLEPPAASSSAQPPLPAGAPPLPAGPAPLPSQAAASGSGFADPQYGSGLPEIDPALAHLLPPSQRGGLAADPSAGQRAAFNARTGRFTPADYAYSVDHLSEYNRAKRMNSHYFDVEEWERQKAEESAKRKRDEEEGGGKKKITKKDMDRFRKKAAEKKSRNQAWLRD